MIIVTPEIATEYYHWIAEKYGITFSEAIEFDDENRSEEDWHQFVTETDLQQSFTWD